MNELDEGMVRIPSHLDTSVKQIISVCWESNHQLSSH